MKLRSITREQKRILTAAAEGRLGFNLRGRYFIDGEDPPDRRERERLQKRGLLTRPSRNWNVLTERGIDAFLNAPVSDAPPSKPEQLALAASTQQIQPPETLGDG